jgi:hypothetical protein
MSKGKTWEGEFLDEIKEGKSLKSLTRPGLPGDLFSN